MKNTITLGGKERPLHFGWYAFKIFEDEPGLSFTQMAEIANDMKVDSLISFIYAGISGGYHKSSIPIDFVKGDIFNWLDDYEGDITEVFELLLKSLPQNMGEQKQPKKKSR